MDKIYGKVVRPRPVRRSRSLKPFATPCVDLTPHGERPDPKKKTVVKPVRLTYTCSPKLIATGAGPAYTVCTVE